MKKIAFIVIGVSLILIWTSCRKSTEPLKEHAKIDNRIFDNIELLNQVQKEDIFSSIQELEKKVGSQIAIVIIDTLNGETLEAYSLKTLENLDLGRKEFKDGILITVVYKEHKIRIEVGYGLEKIIKDEIAARIIRDEMVPKFREDNYFEGIKRAVNKIKDLIEENKKLVGQAP